jgi:pimeloyl-ACP methyl ester carboxylesterase
MVTGTPEFFAAYDAVLAQWPIGTESVDVPTAFGRTRVQICGDGPPLVLLHGGGATSTVWFSLAKELAGSYRLYAPDLVGDPGRSVPTRPIKRVDDLVEWLDGVLTGLGMDSVFLCGHSYGSWIALNYALSRPVRVGRVALLDPATCFVNMTPRYLAHAVPLLLGGAGQVRRFFDWETGGRDLDPAWTQLMVASKGGRWRRPLRPRLPGDARLATLAVPTLVVLAERTRTHDLRRLEAKAQESVPDLTVTLLPGATHHTLPTEDAPVTAAALRAFFTPV